MESRKLLRSYPQQGASQAVTSTTAALAQCGSFTVSWTAPAETAAESVEPLGPVGTGNQSWSASVTVKTSIPMTERLILIQAGSSLLVLQVASAAGAPALRANQRDHRTRNLQTHFRINSSVISRKHAISTGSRRPGITRLSSSSAMPDGQYQ